MGLKKGYYFSVDAILGLSIVLVGILIMGSFYSNQQETTHLTYVADDLIEVLSTVQISDVNNTYVQELIATGHITNTNSSLLEQITKLWVEGKHTRASEMARNITEQIIPDNIMFSILVDGGVVYERTNTSSNVLVLSKELVSGMETGKAPKGSTARMYLTGIKSKETNAYVYFGGFTGQGNVTMSITDLPSDANITEMEIEGDFGASFWLEINEQLCGSFVPVAGELAADAWDITSCNNLVDVGSNVQNNFSISFTGEMEEKYIGGGFIRMKYTTETLYENKTLGNQKIYLPGIDGIINLFSGINIPGTLNQMNLHLHYFSNHSDFSVPLFFSFGDVQVYNDTNSTTPQTIDIDDAQLSSLLDYGELSNTTVPIRFGFSNVSYLTEFVGLADVMLVSDLSGSMEFCMNRNDGYETDWVWTNFNFPDQSGAAACGRKWERDGNCPSNAPRRIDVAKNASKAFVEALFNTTGNRIGTAEYSAFYSSGTYVQQPCGTNIQEFPGGIVTQESLTTDQIVLENHIDDMAVWYGTCICCGVNRGMQVLQANSNASRIGSIVVMTDGDANQECPEQGNTGDLDGDGSSDTARDDAVQAALDACALNYSVYTVGFGPGAYNGTMIAMACNGGSYYSASDMDTLIDAYTAIANQIRVATMQAQTIVVSGNNITSSQIYPDSYIEINYTPTYNPVEFGEISVTLQSDQFPNCSGSWYISDDLTIVDSSATSYSAQHWTDLVRVNNQTSFNLSYFGTDYTSLGDPYLAYVKPESFITGINNITIVSADEIANDTFCSTNNSLIYTAMAKSSVSYGTVLEREEGCNWFVEFEDGGNATLAVPQGYAGNKTCSYTGSSISYDTDDSYDDAMYRLLEGLDFDDDGRTYFNFDQSDIGFNVITISEVPYMWGPTGVEVRTWQ